MERTTILPCVCSNVEDTINEVQSEQQRFYSHQSAQNPGLFRPTAQSLRLAVAAEAELKRKYHANPQMYEFTSRLNEHPRFALILDKLTNVDLHRGLMPAYDLRVLAGKKSSDNTTKRKKDQKVGVADDCEDACEVSDEAREALDVFGHEQLAACLAAEWATPAAAAHLLDQLSLCYDIDQHFGPYYSMLEEDGPEKQAKYVSLILEASYLKCRSQDEVICNGKRLKPCKYTTLGSPNHYNVEHAIEVGDCWSMQCEEHGSLVLFYQKRVGEQKALSTTSLLRVQTRCFLCAGLTIRSLFETQHIHLPKPWAEYSALPNDNEWIRIFGMPTAVLIRVAYKSPFFHTFDFSKAQFGMRRDRNGCIKWFIDQVTCIKHQNHNLSLTQDHLTNYTATCGFCSGNGSGSRLNIHSLYNMFPDMAAIFYALYITCPDDGVKRLKIGITTQTMDVRLDGYYQEGLLTNSHIIRLRERHTTLKKARELEIEFGKTYGKRSENNQSDHPASKHQGWTECYKESLWSTIDKDKWFPEDECR